MPDDRAASDSGDQFARSDLLQDRHRPVWRWVSIAVIAALAIALVAVTTALLTSRSEKASDKQANIGSSSTAITTLPSPPVAAVPPKASFVIDATGWQDSEASCETPDSPVVIARTVDALVVICFGQGGLVYKGVRISDNSFISVDDVTVLGSVYTATNADVQYRVSETDLTITLVDALLSRAEFVEYQGRELPSSSRRQTTTSLPTRTTVPAQSGSTFPEQDDASTSSESETYGRYPSYGEYAGHFQCLAFKTNSAECRRLIEQYGPEAGN